jgi:hypothetical protein
MYCSRQFLDHLSPSLINIQRIIKIQSSRIHRPISISLKSAFSNVILKRRNLIPVFPIDWFSHGYRSLNLDASILLSPETFCQQSISSQHPRASLLRQRLRQTLLLASYVVPCQLFFKHLATSHLLHRCIAATLLDLWIASQEGFKG